MRCMSLVLNFTHSPPNQYRDAANLSESHHVSGGDGARSEAVVRFVGMDQLDDPLLVRRPSLIIPAEADQLLIMESDKR